MSITADDNTTMKRIKLIIKFLESCQNQYNGGNYLSFERNIISILDLFMHKSYANILFILDEIGFSSKWELSKLSLMSALWEIDKRILSLENLKIVERLSEKDDDYCVIKPYWKTEHPTSPSLPVLYKISPIFKSIIKSFSEELRQRYIGKSSFVQTMKRKARYESFYKAESEKIFGAREMELTKMGNCIACEKIIRAGSEIGTDFQKPAAGYVCTHCWTHASDETQIQWMQSKQ